MKTQRNMKGILLVKTNLKTNLKRLYIAWFQPYNILEKANYRDRKKTSGGMNRWSREDFENSETILYDTVMVDTCMCAFVKTHRMNNRKSGP